DRVAQVAAENFTQDPLTGPVVIHFTFYRQRPAAHYGTGRNSGTLKASAPVYPTTRPDALKLARGVEDALTGIVYRDDAQIVEERLFKRYGRPGCEVKVWRVEQATVGQQQELAQAA